MSVYFIDSPTVTWTFNPSTGEASAAVTVVGGGIIAHRSVSSSGTVSATAAETIELVTTSTSTITRTLPAVASSNDVVLTFKKMDSGSGTVVIQTAGSPAEPLDSGTSYDLVSQYQSVRLHCDGSRWNVIGNN